MKRGAPEGIAISPSTPLKKRQMEETIELPEELWLAIFSHLPLNDFTNITQVNKQSLRLIQLLSQQFIQSYFSSAKTEPDFEHNAVKLLTSQYERYRKLFFRIPFHAIFTALNGELYPLKQILSSLLTSNSDKYSLLEYAAENGHLLFVNLLLPKLTCNSNCFFYSSLISAAKHGHYHIVDTFLANVVDITNGDKLDFLSYAIQDKQDNTIDLLLKTLGIHHFFLSSQFKKWTQEAKEEHVKVLLEKAVGISAEDEGWALKYAAENNYLAIVNICLEKATQITNDDKGWALVKAAKQGHLDIVKTLLENTTISNNYKKMAIIIAESKHYNDITTEIKSRLELPPPAVTFAFKQPSSSSSSSSESSEENTNDNEKSSSFSYS